MTEELHEALRSAFGFTVGDSIRVRAEPSVIGSAMGFSLGQESVSVTFIAWLDGDAKVYELAPSSFELNVGDERSGVRHPGQE